MPTIWPAVALIALVAFGGVVIVTVPQAGALDRWWYDTVEGLRTPALITVAHGFDRVGGGLVGVYAIPVLIGLSVLALRGWRSALFAIAAFSVSALAVQLVKHVLGRARPEDLMVAADYGSFPSGHTANAATIAVVLWLLFPHVIIAVLGVSWTVLMGLSRTILAAHWASDVVAGALLGMAAVLLLAALMLRWAREHDACRGRHARGRPGQDHPPQQRAPRGEHPGAPPRGTTG